MKSARTVLLLSLFGALGAPMFAQITGGTCSNASLTGPYSLSLTGRTISSAGSFVGSLQSNGTATFDGNGNVTLTGTANTNLAAGTAFSYTGTYTLASTCSGTMTLTTSGPATFNLIAFAAGKQFAFTGSDAVYTYSGSGGQRPGACGTVLLSGEYLYNASGFTLSGTTQNGSADETGILQFDGQGKLTASYTTTQSGTTATTGTATGTYSVGSNCLGTGTLTDTANKNTTLTFSVTGVAAAGFDLLEANSQFVRTGAGHAAFLNPAQSIGNVSSYAVGSTPPGSVFVIFGSNLATRSAGASTTTLPTTLLNTTVTINGEAAPLFFVDTGQIDAQMPWDIPGGTLASVIVKNGASTSNAAAVFVPATGTPGISVYGNNRAVVVNANGSVNSGSDAAKVGDEVVAYFTGGGPVTAAGKLVTGAPAPNGLSPVTGTTTITVGTALATVQYIGLTPGSIGLYQANFTVPQIAKGTYPLVITIAGQASNNPVMTVSN